MCLGSLLNTRRKSHYVIPLFCIMHNFVYVLNTSQIGFDMQEKLDLKRGQQHALTTITYSKYSNTEHPPAFLLCSNDKAGAQIHWCGRLKTWTVLLKQPICKKTIYCLAPVKRSWSISSKTSTDFFSTGNRCTSSPSWTLKKTINNLD